MTHSFNCIATGIGSLPITDPDKAAALSLQYLPEAPIWPQLPQRDFREQMDGQYSESLPGTEAGCRKEALLFRHVEGPDAGARERSSAGIWKRTMVLQDNGGIRRGVSRVSSRRCKKSPPAKMRFVKGHITGPLTAGISFKDETGKDIVHNDVLFDAVVKGLAMKAAWQIKELGQFNKPVIIFIDEPAMESLGSAFSAVSSEVVAEKLNEIIDTIHELGGIAGIHCCGNADWPMIFNTKVDIVNFDAFGYMEKVMLYPEDIKKFFARGGALAWGVVPTGAFTGTETADLLIGKLEAGIKRLEQQGIEREDHPAPEPHHAVLRHGQPHAGKGRRRS